MSSLQKNTFSQVHINIIYSVEQVNTNLIKHYTDFKAEGKKMHLCKDQCNN